MSQDDDHHSSGTVNRPSTETTAYPAQVDTISAPQDDSTQAGQETVTSSTPQQDTDEISLEHIDIHKDINEDSYIHAHDREMDKHAITVDENDTWKRDNETDGHITSIDEGAKWEGHEGGTKHTSDGDEGATRGSTGETESHATTADEVATRGSTGESENHPTIVDEVAKQEGHEESTKRDEDTDVAKVVESDGAYEQVVVPLSEEVGSSGTDELPPARIADSSEDDKQVVTLSNKEVDSSEGDERVVTPSSEEAGSSEADELPQTGEGHPPLAVKGDGLVGGERIGGPSGELTRKSGALPEQGRLRLHMSLYLKRVRGKKRRRETFAAARLLLVGLLLFGIITPIVLSVGYGLQLYGTYQNLRDHANNGVQHLRNAKDILLSEDDKKSSSSDALQKKAKSEPFDPMKLVQARNELTAARTDFTRFQALLNSTSVIQLAPRVAPDTQAYLDTANTVSRIGINISDVGLELVATGLQLAPNFRGGLLQEEKKPLLTSTDISTLNTTLKRLLPSIETIYQEARTIPLNSLPISAKQRGEVEKYIALMPKAIEWLKAEPEPFSLLAWIMGIDQPRTFLVQTMDRGELRATGGFTGQYGELNIQGGRFEPFTLRNVALLEYSEDSRTYGEVAPEAYRSWWPFANWGLRDSNLSADFPTSAKFALERYEHDTDRSVDGVIAFTPFLIKHVLQATGPILVPRYNETVTAQNLEERLHYYQLSKPGIIKSKQIEHIDDDEQARKMFTTALTKTLMEHVREASPGELLAIGKQMLQDMKTRDLQVYFTNPQVQKVLERYEIAGQLNRTPGRDGLYIVQTNVSVSKATEYVKTTFTDRVTLDSSGGAKHDLTMHFVYNQEGPVYGFDTYRNYVRVYVPPSARLLGGSGFDTGDPLCGGPNLDACAEKNVYPKGELICPPGQYNAGDASPMLNDPYLFEEHPLNKLGRPDNLKSDEAGRAMFAGYLIIPKNCTLTATLSWYVPNIVNKDTGYSLFVQRQAATFPDFKLAIQPEGCSEATPKSSYSNKGLERDTLFTLARTDQSKSDACQQVLKAG